MPIVDRNSSIYRFSRILNFSQLSQVCSLKQPNKLSNEKKTHNILRVFFVFTETKEGEMPAEHDDETTQASSVQKQWDHGWEEGEGELWDKTRNSNGFTG